MCGIAGYVGQRLSMQERRHYLALACKALKHRGPDETGSYIQPIAALGATRLAIRDRSCGSQPMTRNGFTLVFNGELYGIEPLKQRLQQAGHCITSQSDTELFLCALIEYGFDILPTIAGMFAFALWDAKEEVLYLGRDRWGEKPLYYQEINGELIFASEIKGLAAWPGSLSEIDRRAIHTFLKTSYIQSPNTAWKDVRKLEPGSLLTWKKQKYQIHRYYSAQHSSSYPIKEGHDKESELYFKLRESVRSCAVSDRPIGVFLSGGLDSSTVAYLLSREIGPFPVFSIDWEEEDYSEKKYAVAIARHLHLPHILVECTPSFFQDSFETIADVYDEPFADESMFPTFCLAQEAKKHVDVVLTGDGADEFFHGYERYFYKGPFDMYLDIFSATPDKVLNTILNRDFALQTEIGKTSHPPKQNSEDPRMRSILDIHTYLPDDILTKVDRATMAVSLEARAPFLTPSITDFALSCGIEELTCDPRCGKEILRRTMRPYLPPIIAQRKKKGFGMPLKSWFSSCLKDWIRARLFNGALTASGWFCMKGIQTLLDDHCDGNHNHSRTLLNLLVLDNWLSKH